MTKINSESFDRGAVWVGRDNADKKVRINFVAKGEGNFDIYYRDAYDCNFRLSFSEFEGRYKPIDI